METIDQTLPSYGSAGTHYVTTYGYDDASRVTSLTGVLGGVTKVNLAYAWDDAGRMTQITDYAGGRRVDFTYNGLSQYVTVTRYSDTSGTQLVATSTYGYDDANRLTSLTHALNDGSNTTLTYALEYDAADRITQLTTPDGANDYTLDNTGQLTDASLTSESYSYDANGNRTSGGTLTGDDNRISEDATYTYSYDDEGNLTTRTRKDGSGSQTFTWDYRNRLTGVTTRQGPLVQQTAVYAYDPFDRRILRSLQGGINFGEQYVYEGIEDADVALVLDSSGNVTLRQLNGPGMNQVVAEDRIDGSTTSRWALADHEGSVRDVLNNSAAVVDHIVYDSFGNIASQTNASELTRATYTGAPTDTETGFVYLHNRYMDPITGRFISRDPIAFAAGDTNLYRYVGNDPLSGTDPSGLDVDKSTGKPNIKLPPGLQWLKDPATGQWDIVGDNGPLKEKELADIQKIIDGSHALGKEMSDLRSQLLNAIQGYLDADTHWNQTMGQLQQDLARRTASATLIASIMEILAGAGAAAVPTGASQILGGATVLHGSDNFISAWNTLLSGQPTQAVTSQTIQSVLVALGMDPAAARSLAEGTNSATQVALTVGASIPAPGELPLSNSNLPEPTNWGAQTAKGTIQQNAVQGQAWEQTVKVQLQQTQTNVVEQVTVKTQSGTKTRLDFVGNDSGGSIALTEAKSSTTASLTENQATAFPEIQQSGAVVVGKGKPPFVGGTVIPPTPVKVVRPE